MAGTDSKTSPEKVEASMIERVAGRMRMETEPWFPMKHELGGTFAIVLAGAALREMSIPTLEMIEAGMKASAVRLTALQMVVVWQAMLDAALDPGQNVVQGASGRDSEGGGYEATDERKAP